MIVYLLLGAGVVALDQAVKLYILNTVAVTGEPIRLIDGVMKLVFVRNYGAAFSFLSGSNAGVLFVGIALVFLALVIIALKTDFIRGKLERLCLVLIASGGVSNCIDRIVHGYVVDMFCTEFIDFPVFNVADIFITVFTFVFAVSILLSGKDGEK